MDHGVLLYHEAQESKLCALHCVNAVLQGPYFTELELAAIATELDQSEREMMMESGAESADYLRVVSEGSSNVALDGNFSIQVLEKALSALDLKCIPLNSAELPPEVRSNPHTQQAFICNLHEHWLALRKIGSQWFNFNSLLAAPQHLSTFYMSAFLDSLKDEGWSIFVVQGELPRASNPLDSSGAFGRWFTPDEAERVLRDAEEQKQLNDYSSSDPMLEAAISASLRDTKPQRVDRDALAEALAVSTREADETESLAAAIAASLADIKPPRRM